MKRSPMKSGTAGLKRSPIAAGTSSLKRTAIAASSTPLARSAIKPGLTQLVRSSPMVWKQVARPAGSPLPMQLRQRRLRTRGPKMTKIRRSARNQECTFRFAGICRNRSDTTVWCHSNRYADGKGMGIKANDRAGCYGCAECHAYYDGGWAVNPNMSREQVEQVFDAANAESTLILQHKGL